MRKITTLVFAVAAMALGFGSSTPANASCNLSGCGPLRYVEIGIPRVQHDPHVYLIFWGSNWNKAPGSGARTDVINVFESLSGSAYQGILTQYFDSTARVSSQVDVTAYTDTGIATPSNVDGADIHNEITKAISDNGWTDTTEANYIVMTAAGATFAEGLTENECADHGHYDTDTVSTESFVPYGFETVFENCGGKGDAAEWLTHNATHEYAESVLHPLSSTWSATSAASGEDEIADICGGGKLPSGLAVNALYDDHLNECAVADLTPPHVLALTDKSEATEHEATLNATVNPEGLETTYQLEYGPTESYGTSVPASAASVGSGIKNVKVAQTVSGLSGETVYHFRVKATNSTGTTYGGDHVFKTSAWTEEVPDDDSGAKLNDVSCSSLTFCWAVGGTKLEGKPYKPYGERWNGNSWSYHEFHREVHNEDRLLGVSCVAGEWCMVVGAYGLSPRAFSQYTDKGSPYGWSEPTLARPSDSTGDWELNDVSCLSSSYCVAVGWYTASLSPFPKKALIEKWNGKEWTAQSALSPGNPTILQGVSCTSTSACTAVGSYVEAGGATKTLAERWNGTAWSTQTTFNPAGASSSALEDVSCTSSSFCMAAGKANDEAQEGLAERWTGSAWVSAPSLGGPITSVSCPSQTSCVAVGEKSTHYAQGEYWNGTAWSRKEPGIIESGSNVQNPETASGVSCIGSLACTAVGHDTGFWNSHLWRISPTPPTATSEAASAISSTGATLNGSVNPNGFATQYQFEYGTSTSYGSVVPAAAEDVGAGTSAVAVKQTIGGLEAGPLYHFRVVATNGEKKTFGADRTFETPLPTVLCKENTKPCPTASTYPSGTTIEATLKSATKFRLEGTVNENCTGSTLSGKTTSGSGSGVSIEVTKITMSGCEPCASGEVQNLPIPGNVEAGGSGNGTGSLRSSGNKLKFKLTSCSFGGSCTYSTSELGLSIEGGNPATLSTNKSPLTREEGSEFFCGSSAKLNASYEITTPKPLYVIGSSNTVLCKSNLSACSGTNAYAGGTEVVGKLSGLLKYNLGIFGNNSCTGSTMTLTSSAEGGSPSLPMQLKAVSLSGCEPCKKMEVVSPPYNVSLEATGEGKGTLTMPMTIRWTECSLGVSCTFSSTQIKLEVEGGSPALIKIKEQVLSIFAGPESQCGHTTTLNGTYEVTSPKPLWVAKRY